MISLQQPFWLILLALIPLIRWLHRFRQQSQTVSSTTLFLWSKIHNQIGSDQTPATPDPRWLLRALIIFLLTMSLADPLITGKSKASLVIWLDDSLSMFAMEQQQQRMSMAVQQLNDYLDNHGTITTIRLHSLGNPASAIILDSDDESERRSQLTTWTAKPRGEPLPPLPATLSADDQHILITDGADANLNKWALSVPLQHIIRVGQSDQNIALTHLSLRPPLKQSDSIQGLVHIDNLSHHPQEANLNLYQGNELLETQKLTIPAAEKIIRSFSIKNPQPGTLKTSIQNNNDALLLDNELHLELKKLYKPLAIQMQGECNPYVMAVVNSHPALVLSKKDFDLIIDCSGQHHTDDYPILRLHPAQTRHKTRNRAHWHNASTMPGLQLPAGIAYSDAAPLLSSMAVPVLSADNRLLILKATAASAIIDCYLDTSNPAFARQPEYPLLIYGLISQLTGYSLETALLATSRNKNASQISPVSLSKKLTSSSTHRISYTSLSTHLLQASVLLLIIDAVLALGLTFRPWKYR